jgi:hypothetical protein
MSWNNGHYSVAHPRERWDAELPDILVQASLETLKGADHTPARDVYIAAKYQFAMGAAEQVVNRCISKRTVDLLVAHTISRGINSRIVFPHPAFDDEAGEDVVSKTYIPRNALPFAYRAYLSRILGCPVDDGVIQIARVGRTKLNKWDRFLYQPMFGGVVRAGQTYIIADDVACTAGTFASLASYITRNGGRVVFATVLASGSGKDLPFPITEQTVNQLVRSFGPELDRFWTETVGHGITCLTEAEGKFLREWSDAERSKGSLDAGAAMLRRLRDRLDAAAAKNG